MKHQYMICAINKVPHVILDAATGKHLDKIKSIPSISIYSEHDMPDWPILQLVKDVFGNDVLMSTCGHIIAHCQSNNTDTADIEDQELAKLLQS